MKQTLLTCSILLFLQTALFAQSDSRALILPDAQMEQVVKKILTRYFNAPAKPKTIYVAAYHIKKEWLPNIHNIKFVLVDNPANSNGLYFFRFGAWNGQHSLTINFAIGDAACQGKGDTWSVNIRRPRVKLRLVSTKFLISCDLEDRIID